MFKRQLCRSILAFLFLSSFGLTAQDMQRVKQTIDTLSSPSFHGRGYVSQGDQLAAQYIAQKFSEIGLKAFQDEYFQYFPLNINTFPNKIKLKINKTQLEAGSDYLVSPISKAGKGKAELIMLDSLFFEDAVYQREFLSQDLPEKILAFEHRDFSKIVELSQRKIDKLFSAKAILELKESKLVGSLSNRQLSNPIFEITKQTFDEVLAKGNQAKSKVKFRLDAQQLRNYESQNVIAYIEGSSEPDSFLVVTAHYDHLGRMGKDVYFPGANDNASGVAFMLELAHYYSQEKNRPKYSLVFMAFGAEEVGLLGSKHYVENPFFPLRQIKFLLNMDLVGTGDDGATVVNGLIFKEQFTRLRAINNQRNYLPVINARGMAANSDHFFFSEKKVPSFFLYTLGGIKAYHDIYDQSETLPLTRFPELFRLVVDFLDSFALVH